jgi:hypothetical protein
LSKFLHHVVLALALAELHHRNLLLFRETFHRCHEGLRRRVQQRRRGKRVPAVNAANFTTPLSHCSIGTYTFRYIRSMHSVGRSHGDSGYRRRSVVRSFRLRFDSGPSGSIAASAAKLVGRNCLQFLTVDRCHCLDCPIRPSITPYILSAEYVCEQGVREQGPVASAALTAAKRRVRRHGVFLCAFAGIHTAPALVRRSLRYHRRFLRNI